MTAHSQHPGLYISKQQYQYALSARDSDAVVAAAWRWLLAAPGDELPPRETGAGESDPRHREKLKGQSAALADAFRYQFADDSAAGDRVLQYLQQDDSLLPGNRILVDKLMRLTTAAQIVELVRTHPGYTTVAGTWLPRLATAGNSVLAASADEAPQLAPFWKMTLRVVLGITLKDESLFQQGVQQFRQLVNEQIHPEGYLRSLTDIDRNRSFHWHTLAVAALTLAAEAATQAETDLWAYENRGVGVTTAAAYLMYYYFYPAKWRWQDDLTETDTFNIFKNHGAWIEIVTYRGYLRGVDLLLEQQRPFYSAQTGGLTTLTHPQVQQKKRRGWFS
jgi:hypothetical protein